MKTPFLVFIFCLFFPPFILAQDDLSLEGINYDSANPSESLAIINGELLKAGQSVAGYQILKVELQKVHLKNTGTGEELVLDVNQEFNSKKANPKTPQKKPAASFDLFNSFHKKTLSDTTTGAEKKSLHQANWFDSMFSAVQGMLPMGGPLGDYRKFIDNIFLGKFSEAKAYALPNSAASSSVQAKEKSFSPCTASHGKRFSHASYKLESQTKKSDKEVEIQVIQTVRGDPPGVTSAYGATAVLYKHKALLTQTKEGWKVKSFQMNPVSNTGMGTYWLCVD